MKKLMIMAGIGFLAIAGCEVCDAEVSPQADNSFITGVYTMKSFHMPHASDLNGDGIFSADLTDENDCPENSVLSVNDNFTYTLINFSLAVSGNQTACIETMTSGTWQRTGFTFTTTDQNGIRTDYDFKAAQKTLTHDEEDAHYPYEINGEMMNGIGNVRIVFKRQ